MQNQIIYSKDECNCKSQLINLMLECVFKSHIPKVKSYKNSNTLLTPNGDCEFLKDLLKTTIRIFLVTATLMIIDFMLYVFKIYMSQSHHVK